MKEIFFLLTFVVFASCEEIMTGGRKTFSPEEIERWKEDNLCVNGKNKTYGQVVKESEIQYNKESNSMFLYKMGEIESVQSQVVEGIMYYVKVNMQPTECTKTEENIIENVLSSCPVTNGNNQYVEIKIWYRSWLSGDEQLQVDIKPILEDVV